MTSISAVVATKNEALNIEFCLKSLLGQNDVSIEIIVVDNNSSDGTRDIASRYTSKVFNLIDEVDLRDVTNYRGAQVNFGVTKASGDYIFFPDADMTFEEGLLFECIKLTDKCDGLYIPEVICGRGIFGILRDFERSFYNGTCIDALRFVKKCYFDKVGGFDVVNIVFGPDDWDLTKKLRKEGVSTGITVSKIYHHEERLSLWKYIEKKHKYVPTLDGYIKKWGSSDEDIARQFGFWYRYFGVFVEHGKWKRLLLNPIKTAGMYFIRIIVGVRYISSKLSVYTLR